MNEAFEDAFSADSRAWRTLFALLFRPGFLSLEYFNGRRARYVQPIRLYIISSVFFFVFLTVVDFFKLTGLTILDDQATTSITQGSNSNDDQALKQALEQLEKLDEYGEKDRSLEISEAGIRIPFISEESQTKLNVFVEKQLAKGEAIVKDDPGAIIPALLELSPPVIFCLLPLFALLLKLIYIGRGFYYAEHLVLALHNHSFVFMWLTIYTALGLLLKGLPAVWSSISWVFDLWVPLYLWISLKTVFGQGLLVTSLKYFVVGLVYSCLLGAGILLALLIGVLTL